MNKFYVIIGILIGILVFATSFVFIYGAEFKYNLTKELQDETRLLQVCMYNDSIKIPELEEKCNMIYGGKIYGNDSGKY